MKLIKEIDGVLNDNIHQIQGTLFRARGITGFTIEYFAVQCIYELATKNL